MISPIIRNLQVTIILISTTILNPLTFSYTPLNNPPPPV